MTATTATAPVLLKTVHVSTYTVTVTKVAEGEYLLFFKANIGREKGYFEFDGTRNGLRALYERPTSALRFFLGTHVDKRYLYSFWDTISDVLLPVTTPEYHTQSLEKEAMVSAFKQLVASTRKAHKNPKEVQETILQALSLTHYLVETGPEYGYLEYVAFPQITMQEGLATHPLVRTHRLYSAGSILLVVGKPVYDKDGRGTREVLWCKA